jgi:hypothetical protein
VLLLNLKEFSGKVPKIPLSTFFKEKNTSEVYKLISRVLLLNLKEFFNKLFLEHIDSLLK